MAQVVCPNCRAVVAPLSYCQRCNSPLVPASSFETESTADAVIESLAVRTTAAAALLTIPIESLETTDVDVLTQMDPRLQRAVVRSQQGILKLPTASTEVDEVAVVAVVTDTAVWESL